MGSAAGNDEGAANGSHGAARTRVLGAFGAAALAFGATWLVTPWQISALIGYTVGAIVFIVWVWMRVGRLDGETTAAHAAAEDDSRRSSDAVVILAAVTSLVGVGLSLLEASDKTDAAKAFITALAAASVLLSWATVHTVFTLRYASMYYTTGGGIDFNEERLPTYGDFAYLAFTIGMTYQVSDTSIASKTIRRTALRHGYMSYLFGTVVVAITINLVAGLLDG